MDFNYKHIVWDWNGTLLDDAGLCLDIINGLLYKRNIPGIDLKRYKEVFDFPVIDFYIRIGFDFSIEPFHCPATEYIDEYNRRRFQCSLHADALDMLSFFQLSGKTQSLLSASKQSSLEEAVLYYSLHPYFTNISGLNDYYANGKIDLGRKHLSGLDTAKHEIVMIGDTTHDYNVAEALGIDCVLIDGGHQSRNKLESCGVPVFDSLSGLKNYIRIIAGA